MWLTSITFKTFCTQPLPSVSTSRASWTGVNCAAPPRPPQVNSTQIPLRLRSQCVHSTHDCQLGGSYFSTCLILRVSVQHKLRRRQEQDKMLHFDGNVFSSLHGNSRGFSKTSGPGNHARHFQLLVLVQKITPKRVIHLNHRWDEQRQTTRLEAGHGAWHQQIQFVRKQDTMAHEEDLSKGVGLLPPSVAGLPTDGKLMGIGPDSAAM